MGPSHARLRRRWTSRHMHHNAAADALRVRSRAVADDDAVEMRGCSAIWASYAALMIVWGRRGVWDARQNEQN